MKKITSLIAGLLLTMLLFAQKKEGTISGTIINADKKPVESATVQLLRASDKGLVKTAVTDNGGAFHSKPFVQACIALNIKQRFTRPYRPQTNVTAGRSESSRALA